MTYPNANDYSEAVLHPLRRFCRAELKRSQVVVADDGKPLMYPGKYRDVFEMRSAGGFERWAIGCFKAEPHGLAHRYYLINAYLTDNLVPCLVESEYLEQGICVRGRWYPITRSRWVKGLPLCDWVRKHVDHAHEMTQLADAWLRLVRDLRHAGFAHGNLCSDTILVGSDRLPGTLALHLLDYDAVYLPVLDETPAEEMGHVDYQHPQRLSRRWYHAHIDRFSQLAVYAALHALAVGGRTLWQKYDNGSNMVFRERDFQEPATSAVFQELWRSPHGLVRELAGHLILATQADVHKVPALEPLADAVRSAVADGTPARSSLTPEQVDQIEKLLADYAAVSQPQDLEIVVGDEQPAGDGQDAFALVIEDDAPPTAAARPRQALAIEDPNTRTFTLDAWMPEQVAVLKLQGFVKDRRGAVVHSAPGMIRVHLADEGDFFRHQAPALFGWLGFGQHSQGTLQVAAVMELELAHKMSGVRKLVEITMRLSPGPDQPVPQGWDQYCQRVFVYLRAYLIGT
jgi:hypothetical protein